MFGFSQKEKEEKARKERERRMVPSRTRVEENNSDFGTSMIMGMVTDNALLGYAAGGDLLGGMMGQALADTTSALDTSSPSCDSSYSDSSSSSYDSGCSSGSDSGSCGGCD